MEENKGGGVGERLHVIGEKEAAEAVALLEKYKRQKAELDRRIIENEEWWKMRYAPEESESGKSSAWLFNSIANKHADAMDNYPTPVILPREQSDKDAAKKLSAVVPAVLEATDFDEVYSEVWYDKLKFGAGCYGVFWNPSKLNGLGDVEITHVDLLSLFWEGGVGDLQKSSNVFHVELFANDYLEREYPMLKDALTSSSFTKNKYYSDLSSDEAEKSAVIDWYYKKKAGGREVLHYAKICAGKVLFASENEQGYDDGFYAHGKYPFFIDPLYPIKASPVGFGMIDVMKGAQMQIDQLGEAIVKNARMSSGVRYFIRSDGSVNEEEFSDFSKPMVHVQGARLGDDSIRQITVAPLDSSCVTVMNNKISELKETSGNRDFSQGGTTGGITAASAIAALQEAGSKLSRDMVRTTYRVFSRLVSTVIELIREFYTEPRFFRIIGDNEGYEFLTYFSGEIAPQKIDGAFGLELGERLPVFDVKVSAERQSPFARASQNELAKEFYKMGIFDPARSNEAVSCISMMDFEGKDALVSRLKAEGVRYFQTMSGGAEQTELSASDTSPFGEMNAVNRAFGNFKNSGDTAVV